MGPDFNLFLTNRGLDNGVHLIQRPAYAEDGWLVRRSMELQTLLQPASIVATSLAGIPAYFTDFRMVDFLGYNEKTIAGMDSLLLSTADFKGYIPGHVKMDIHYTVTNYNPDFIFYKLDFFFPSPEMLDFFRGQGYEYNNEFEDWQKSSVFSET